MNAVVSSAENTDHEGEVFEDVPDSTAMKEAKGAAVEDVTSQRPVSPSSDPTPKATISEHPTTQSPISKDGTPARVDDDGAGEQSEIITKSPLLTTHRKSTESLEDGKSGDTNDRRHVPEPTSAEPITLSDNTDPSTKPISPPPSRFTGFSASLPGVPWGNSSTKSNTNLPPPLQPPSRKISAPFSWLNRTGSASKEGKSPPQHSISAFTDRRNTATPLSATGSNPDLLLKTLDEASEAGVGQGSRPNAKTLLRNRFKTLRMREEAGITSIDDLEKTEGDAVVGLPERSTSRDVGVASPSTVGEEIEGGLAASPNPSSSSVVALSTINENLAPGTVSGISTAASDAVAPIDWDFWQSVVNDGPQAVARASPEEMAQSIASGIPQTIRGVIWQLLAGSKNEDLEGVYRDLLLRGTEKELKDGNHQIALPNEHVNGITRGKDSIASSSSSMQSGRSTPATSTNAGVTSPTTFGDKDGEAFAKAQDKLTVEREKKVKDDAITLQKLEKMIRRDMGTRTSYAKYAVAAGFQDGLFNVCKAYALFDEAVGYPQGMNFIIMPLLFTMPEEEAFCLLVRLMNKYSLREMFVQDMPGLHLHLYQFERLLEDLEPVLYCHLNRRGVSPKLYATQWFMTLFAYRFPLQLVMRVFDLVVSEGLEAAILKFGLALLQKNVSTLLALDDMAALTNFLKEKLFDVYIDHTPSHRSILESGFFGSSGGADTAVYRADLLVQDACAVKLTPELLKVYSSEWAEKVRVEHDRQAELEQYRSTTAAQATKVRSLEVRVEQSDKEHVQIATDLVRLKVDNQELHDSNESLRHQVEELKKVMENEAAAVEARLKGEMDRVMQRNIEVQNENRLMEESMAEMEASLVETKMKYAEMTANHETLKQKWNDLRKALD